MSRAEHGTAVAAGFAVLLGAFALTPVYATTGWVPSVVLTVAGVTIGGVFLRAGGRWLEERLAPAGRIRARLAGPGVLLVPLGQLLLLTVLLTVLFAPRHAFAGLVPTRGSLAALMGVFRDGGAELQEQATPALPLHGLLALTVVLVGLVAVAVDLVAVTGQQPALAGLGLLVVFCVPVATIRGSVGWVALVAPAAGLGLLLWADQRRRLTQGVSGRRSSLGTGTLPALRIGAVALAVGIVGGGLVPTLAEGTFTDGEVAGGSGATLGTSLDPVATLHGELTRPDPIDLLRLRASVSDPGYLRSVSLDQYDAQRGWSLGSLDGEASVSDTARLAELPSREPSRTVTARITAVNLNDRFLPVPTAPVRVTVPDPQSWRFDPTTGTVFGRGTTTAGRSYQVTATEPRPTTTLLESAPPLSPGNPLQRRYTQLPGLPVTVTDLVASLTASASSPYARVRAILDYFTDPANGFTYSLSTTPGTSGDHLVDFLHFRRGYCEQYAGAMAVMVRAAGVPARVALGYVPGTVSSNGSGSPNGTRVITTDDAHAWVEVYFADLGWVPFDPTPLAASRAVTLPWAPRVDPQAAAALGPQAAAPAAPTRAGATKQLDRGDTFVALQLPTATSSAWLRPVLIGAGVLLVLLALAAVPALARVRRRRHRLADGSPGALWDELVAVAADLGLRPAPARTLRQSALELAEVMAGAAPDDGGSARRPDPSRLGIDGVRRLALAEEAASYARGAGAAADAPLVPALRAARLALFRAVPRRRRLRAVLWPASVLDQARERWAARPRQTLGMIARARRT